MSRMRFVGVAVTILLAGAVSVAASSDFFFPLFGAYRDYDLANVPSACGESSVITSSSAVVFDGTLLVHYVCSNVGTPTPLGQREVWRRYFRPVSGTASTPAPTPVYLVNPDGSPSMPAPPSPVDECRAHNLVPAKLGGCVPANHPDARR